MARTASLERITKETKINLSIQIDGSGKSDIHTGVGFFDHTSTVGFSFALAESEDSALAVVAGVVSFWELFVQAVRTESTAKITSARATIFLFVIIILSYYIFDSYIFAVSNCNFTALPYKSRY